MGAYSIQEMQNKYNSTASVRDVYNYFDIPQSDVMGTSASIVNGVVTKTGVVTVNGQIVATNAV